MYEENENKIDWAPIIKKIVMILAVVLVIFGIITLVSKCTKGKQDDKLPSNPNEYSLEKQLDKLEQATLEYLTKDNIPTTLNASKTIRLKILVNNKIVDSITTDDNVTCDTNESYSEITRLENNYAVKMSLSCGKNKASRVIYVGCFENCNGGICKGDEAQTGGVCGENVTPPTDSDDKNDSSNNGPVTPNINGGSNSNTNNGPVKPNINGGNNSNNNNNNSNNNSNNNNGGSTNTNKPSVTLYEYKKCTKTAAYCTTGQMNAYGSCDIYGWKTLEGKVITLGGTSGSTKKVAAKKTETFVRNVYFSRPTDAKNTATKKYVFVTITNDMRYQYKEYAISYKCDGNVKPQSDGYCYYTTAGTPGSKSCEDKSYTYNASTNKCTKNVQEIVNVVPAIPGRETCETTWSSATSLVGWTRTGRTK